MTEDNDLFDQGEVATPTTTEGVSPEAPARDAGGRFTVADKGEVAPPEPVGAPPAPKPEAGHIPITALLEEREKRQRYEQERDDFRRQLEALRAQQQAPAIPDVIEDQQGFMAYQQQQMAQLRDNLEAQFSERFARSQFGSEAVDAALSAAQQAGVVRHFVTGPDRWERMCAWHKQQMAMSEIGDDPAAYRAKIEAELRAQITAEMGASPTKAPPKSLASASGTGVASPTAGGDPLFS